MNISDLEVQPTLLNIQKVLNLHNAGFTRGQSTGLPGINPFYTIRHGDFTVITGIPMHGKSEFLDQLMVNLVINNKWKIGVYSPENTPNEHHAKKMIEKIKKKNFFLMNEEEVKIAAETIKKHFFFISAQIEENTKSLDQILIQAKAIRDKQGLDALLIDSWSEIDHLRRPDISETDYISESLTKIRNFARNNRIHLWVVAHPTKLKKLQSGVYPVPTPYDIAGSAHWRNKPDICLCIWRDVTKPESPVQLYIQKIRSKEIGKIGRVDLKYDLLIGVYSDLVYKK